MPWRLILAILIFSVFLIFIIFNLDFKCNVWIFKTFEDVPIFLTIFISFILGSLCTFPLMLRSKKTNKNNISVDKLPSLKKPKLFKRGKENPDNG